MANNFYFTNVNQLKKENYKINKFSSVNALIDYLERNENTGRTWRARSHDKKTSDFFYYNDYNEALNGLRYGWQEGSKLLNERFNHLVNTNKKATFKPIFSVVGGQASVPRYLQGIPTNMILNQRKEVKDKIVNVYKNVSYSAWYTADEIILDSAETLNLVYKLEKEGKRVNLFVFEMSDAYKVDDNNGRIRLQMVQVKKSSERINVAKVAFCMANPDFLRRICFKLDEIDNLPDSHYIGYGKPFMVDACKVAPEDVKDQIIRKLLGAGKNDIVSKPMTMEELKEYKKKEGIR